MSTATPPVPPVRFTAPDFDAMAAQASARPDEFTQTGANPADDGTGSEDWVCGRCDRGQCGKCADPDCTCCNGNLGERGGRV